MIRHCVLLRFGVDVSNSDNEAIYQRLASLQSVVPGFERIELFRSDLGDEVEFMTIMWFASWDAVKVFAGGEHETAYVPASARSLLTRLDERPLTSDPPRRALAAL